MINLSSQIGEPTVKTDFVDSLQKSPLLANKFDIFEAPTESLKYYHSDKQEASVGENTVATDGLYRPIYFEQGSVSTLIEISQKQANYAPIDIVQTSENAVIPRTERAMLSHALGKGTADGNIQSIFAYNTLPLLTKDTEATDAAKIADIEDFTDIKTMFANFFNDTNNLTGATLYVHDALIAMDFVDGNGNPLLKTDNKADGTMGTIHGADVVAHKLEDAQGIKQADAVLVRNMAYGYSVSKKTHNDQINEGDTQYSSQGTIGVYGDSLVSGRVVNPYGIKIYNATVGTASVGESVEVEAPVKAESVETDIVENPVKKANKRKVKGE